MDESKTCPTEAIDFRAHSYYPDGTKIVISLATKDSAERRTYSLPVNCLYAFIADLQTLQPRGATRSTPGAATTSIDTSASRPTVDRNKINITIPKKWMLRSGLPDHPVVIMVFDPQTETQAGFALSATSAKEMAAGLTKYADALALDEARKSRTKAGQ